MEILALATLQKKTGSYARLAQRAWQEQVGYFSTGNRELVGERLDAEVRRTALPHHRSESIQLARKVWDKDHQNPYAGVRNVGRWLRERVNSAEAQAAPPFEIL